MNKTQAKFRRNGMLILDGKAQLALDCASVLDRVIHPKSVKNFNVLLGIGPEVLARTLQIVNTKGKPSGSSEYFNGQARNLIFYGGVFHRALVEQKLARLNLSSLTQVLMDMVKAVDPQSGTHPIIERMKFHKDFQQEGTLVNDAIKKFMAIQELAQETKSSIFSTAESWIIPLMQSEALRPWADCETSDVDIADVLKGAKFGFCLPEAEFGIAGIAITTLMKARLYQLVQARGDKRPDQDNTDRATVFLIVDEVQRILDDTDLAILPVARSLDLVCVFATQNVDSFYEKFGHDGGRVILDSFRSVISFKSSAATYEWLRERIGKARLFLGQSNSQRVDLALTAKLDMSNPIFDPKNSQSGWMKWKSFSLFKTLFTREEKVGTHHLATLGLSEQPEHIVRDQDLQALNEPFVAIACVERGSVPRRDLIKTVPLDNQFKPFGDSAKQQVDEAKEEFMDEEEYFV